MNKRYTDEENQAWLKSEPKKMIVVKTIIESTQGNILLLKSTYKDTWQLPGGTVELGESPEDGAIREVKEETGLSIDSRTLSIAGTIYKPDEEIVFIIYRSNVKIPEEIELNLQLNEVEKAQFISPNNALSRMSDYYKDFWNNSILNTLEETR